MEHTKGLISVIVPVYNVEPYIEQCLDSIVNQTYTRLEIILINDGSSDRSGAICDAYADRDRRIRVIHKENGGQSSARNVGLDVATGEFVAFVDSDDWLHLDAYEQCMRYVERYPQLDVLSYSLQECFPDGRIVPFIQAKEERHLQDIEVIQHLSRHEVVWEYVSDKLWRREFLGSFRFVEGRINEDAAFTLDIFGCSYRCQYHHMPKILYNYRKGRAEATTYTISEKSLHDQFGTQKEIVMKIARLAPEHAIWANTYYVNTLKRYIVGILSAKPQYRHLTSSLLAYTRWGGDLLLLLRPRQNGSILALPKAVFLLSTSAA